MMESKIEITNQLAICNSYKSPILVNWSILSFSDLVSRIAEAPADPQSHLQRNHPAQNT